MEDGRNGESGANVMSTAEKVEDIDKEIVQIHLYKMEESPVREKI